MKIEVFESPEGKTVDVTENGYRIARFWGDWAQFNARQFIVANAHQMFVQRFVDELGYKLLPGGKIPTILVEDEHGREVAMKTEMPLLIVPMGDGRYLISPRC